MSLIYACLFGLVSLVVPSNSLSCFTCSGASDCRNQTCEGNYCSTLGFTMTNTTIAKRYRVTKSCLNTLPPRISPNTCYTTRHGTTDRATRITFCACNEHALCNSDSLFENDLTYYQSYTGVTCCLDFWCKKACTASYCVRYMDENVNFRYDCAHGSPLLFASLLPTTLVPTEILESDAVCFSVGKGTQPLNTAFRNDDITAGPRLSEVCYCASQRCNRLIYPEYQTLPRPPKTDKIGRPIPLPLHAVVPCYMSEGGGNNETTTSSSSCHGHFCVLHRKVSKSSALLYESRWCMNTTHPELLRIGCISFTGAWLQEISLKIGHAKEEFSAETLCICKDDFCNQEIQVDRGFSKCASFTIVVFVALLSFMFSLNFRI